MGSFCSSKPQVSTYTPPAAVTQGYNTLLNFATPLLNQPYQPYQGNLVQGLTPMQQAAGQGIAGLAGSTDPYFGAAAGLALQGSQPLQMRQFTPQAVQQYESPYLQNVMGSTAQNIMETNAQQQNQLLGNAIQRGAFGGDRGRVAQAELTRQQNLANNATLANIANQGYTQALGQFNQQQMTDLQRQLQSGQLAQSGAGLLAQMGPAQQQANLSQLGAQLQYGGLQQQLGQAGLSTAYQQFLNQQQHPYNIANWFGGLMGGAASGMGGTTTTTAAQPSLFNQILGFGGALGAMGGSGGIGGLGSSLMSGLGAILPFSDERLKENIKHVGKTNDGQNIYSYNFKGEDPLQTHLGLMAQEVEMVKPEAVHDFGGFKTVDYQAATKEAAIPHMADGGVPSGILGMSPIAGMQAQSYVPQAMQSQGGFKPPQQPQMVDPNKDLEGAVKNIRAMMGTKQEPAKKEPAKQEAPRQLGPTAPVGVEGIGTNTTDTIPAGTADLGQLYADGGSVNPFNFGYGLQTKDDLSQMAQSHAGSGMMGLRPEEEAEAATGILGAAMGGRIHYADGGPAETGGLPDRPLPTTSAGSARMQDEPPPDVETTPVNLTRRIPQAPKQPDFLSYILPRESGGNPNARNPNSSASGIAQITDATYQSAIARNPALANLGKNDPRVIEDIRSNNARILQSQDIEPTNQNQYMSWFLGAGGGPRFIKGMQENPNRPATELAQPGQVSANRTVFFNRDGTPRTASEVFNFLNRPMGGQGVIAAAPQGAQAPQGVVGQTTRPPASPEEARIPIQSRATKEGLFGMLGIEMTPEQRLAFIQASLKLAGTPGRPGVGLAAAADTYAKTLLEAQKGQRESATAQAGTERERAAARLSEQEAASKGIMPTYGGLIRTTPTPGGGVQVESIRVPKPGERTVVGEPGTSAQPETGAPKAPTAPTGTEAAPPTVGGVQQAFNFMPLAANEKAAEKLSALDRSAERILQQASGLGGQEMRKEFSEINGQAQSAGKAAGDAVSGIQSLIKAVASVPANGLLTGGALDDFRYSIAKYIDTAASVAGVNLGISDLRSNKEVLEKLSRINTQELQRGLGREAGFWLSELAKSYPSTALSREAAASLAAEIISKNQLSIDRAQLYRLYGDKTYDTGIDAERVFREVAPAAHYAEEKKLIENILLDRRWAGKNNPLILLQQNPTSRESFDREIAKRYGPANLSRYVFGS